MCILPFILGTIIDGMSCVPRSYYSSHQTVCKRSSCLYWLFSSSSSLPNLSIGHVWWTKPCDGTGTSIVDSLVVIKHKTLIKYPKSEDNDVILTLKVSRLLQFPCRYHPMGCKQSFPLSQKGAHERDCAFLQLKCPFHGQCVFNGSLADVVPHLAAEHAVTPVPVQPAGTLFYRAKNFYRRNIWTLIYSWDRPSNLFRFIVKHVHATQVGRTDNCNLLIAHIQYIGPESMASRYDYRNELDLLSVLFRSYIK